MGAFSRRKGAAFEREVAKAFRARGFKDAQRYGFVQAQSSKCPDVEGTPFWIECKHQKKVDIRAAFEQAQEAQKPLPEGGVRDLRWPVVVSRDTGKPILVTLSLDAFLQLLPACNFPDYAAAAEVAAEVAAKPEATITDAAAQFIFDGD